MQKYQEIDEAIRSQFSLLKAKNPEKLKRRLNLGWNSCLFGLEDIEKSLDRLARYSLGYVEIGGIYGGAYERYDPVKLNKLFKDYGVKCSGVCGLFYDQNCFTNPDRFIRNRAKEYVVNELALCKEIGAAYLLVVPGSTGVTQPYNATDYQRAVLALRDLADLFLESNVLCAFETINAGETPMINTIEETIGLIRDIGREGVGHINGDVYHMMLEEKHIGQAILDAGDYLVNLHMADSNRQPIGYGSMDLDTIIRALYLIGYNQDGRFVTGEPIGLGRRARALLDNVHDGAWLDKQVNDATTYFREREEAVLAE